VNILLSSHQRSFHIQDRQL